MARRAAPPDAALPPPAPFRFAAPESWRAIDFVSDLHLSAALPRTRQALARHLAETPADAVFVLGDLFELWVGDDARTRPFEHACVEMLAEASSHRTLAFMAGNRDFLLGAAMRQDCGLLGLPDPTVLDAWGRPVLLMHGDALCLDDEEYQAFRREVRARRWQQDFLAKPLAERLAIAAEIRRRSTERRRFDSRPDADLDAEAMAGWMRAVGASVLVHGHTHRPASEAIAPGLERHVLSDWDLDDPAAPRAEVLRLTREGFARLGPVAAS